MKKKIAYCLPSLYASGGMERVLTVKANYLADVAGYDVYIILTDGKDKNPYYELSSRVNVINLDVNFDKLGNKPSFRKLFSYLHKQHVYKTRLRKTLYEIKPDITISMLRREINFINSIKDGSKKIGEIHFNKSNYRQFSNKFLPAFINRGINKYWMKQLIKELKKLSCFVALSNEDRVEWTELDNVRVIYNPLSFFPDETSLCTSKKVIAVGRYTWQKGFDRLIAAWKEVASTYPDWQLYIYGSGDNEYYRKLAEVAGVGKQVHCERTVEDIAAKYRESSIFVLSSRFEGFGMVLAEAMASGLPVVSFDCPCGPKDIINDGENGFLVANGNIKELAARICYLINNEEKRKEIGRNARNSTGRFDKTYIMNQWINLFESL